MRICTAKLIEGVHYLADGEDQQEGVRCLCVSVCGCVCVCHHSSVGHLATRACRCADETGPSAD